MVYGLVANLAVAEKIAKAAKNCHLAVHNFDRAEPLLDHMRRQRPVLVILDWESREAEAFKVLKEMMQDADLKGVPSIGFTSPSKMAAAGEARRAGCHRVYPKTELMQDLELIMARYAQ